MGFGLQTVRFCVRLLTEPESATVFLEHDDDVSVLYEDGSKLLEQTKRGEKNPFSDWSTDFWKTIHNWIEDQSPIATGSAARLCLFAAPRHEPGQFAKALATASSDNDIKNLVAEITVQSTPQKKSTAVYGFTKRFLAASSEEQLALARRFEIIAEDEPMKAITNLYVKAVSPSLLDRIAAYALGEAKHQSDRLLEAGKTAALNAGAFQELIRHFVQQINLPAYFDFDLPAPHSADVDSKIACRPIFLRQLELVKIEKEQQWNAVSDYLRAMSSKTRWGEEGTLLPQSLDEWEETLVSRHKAICDSLNALHGSLDEVNRGKAVYAECRRLSVSLQGKSVPDHFTHGCLNELSDNKRVGWHPQFLDLLD